MVALEAGGEAVVSSLGYSSNFCRISFFPPHRERHHDLPSAPPLTAPMPPGHRQQSRNPCHRTAAGQDCHHRRNRLGGAGADCHINRLRRHHPSRDSFGPAAEQNPQNPRPGPCTSRRPTASRLGLVAFQNPESWAISRSLPVRNHLGTAPAGHRGAQGDLPLCWYRDKGGCAREAEILPATHGRARVAGQNWLVARPLDGQARRSALYSKSPWKIPAERRGR